MPDINIRLKISDDGTMKVLDDAGGKLGELGKQAEQSKSGFNVMGLSLTDLKSGLDMLAGGLKMAGGVIAGLNELGTESYRAKAALDALSGGRADEYINAMSRATSGLVKNTELAADANKMLGLGLVQNAEQAATLARAGTILGQTFRGDAAQGVETLTVAMTRVGLTGLLDNIGISGEKVKNRFQELKETMGDEQAWHLAVLEQASAGADKLAGTLNSTGTAVDRLRAKWENLVASMGEKVAASVEITLNGGLPEAMGKGVQGYMEDLTPTTPYNSNFYDAYQMPYGGDLYDPRLANNVYGRQAGIWARTPYNPNYNDFNPGPVPANPNYSLQPGQAGGGGGSIRGMLANDQAAMAAQYFVTSGQGRDTAWSQMMESAQGKNQWYANYGFAYNNPQQYREAEQNMVWQQNQAYDKAAQEKAAADAAKQYNDLLRQGLDWLDKQAEALKRRNAIQSVAQAFNIQRDGLYAEVGGDMQDAYSAARQGYEQQERRKGVSGKRLDADMASFDDSARQAMEKYALATGQATRESLMFDDARRRLQQGVETGKISWNQYADGLLALANAAKNGQTSMSDLYQVMKNMAGTGGIDAWMRATREGTSTDTYLSRMAEGHAPAAGAGPTDKAAAASDPYAAVKKSADEAMTASQKLSAQAPLTGLALLAGGAVGANGMGQIANKAGDALRNVLAVASAIQGLNGISVSFNVSVSGGGSSGGGARPGSHGGYQNYSAGD